MPGGEPEEGPTEQREPVLSRSIAMERLEVEVVLLAVGLERHLYDRIGEVEEGHAGPVRHPPLELGTRQPEVIDDGEDEILEPAVAQEPTLAFGDQVAHDRDAVAAPDRPLLDLALDRRQVDLASASGLVERPAQRDRMHHRPQVDDGAVEGRDRDAVDLDCVGRVMGERLVHAEAVAVLTKPAPAGHLDDVARAPAQQVESGGAAVRGHGARRAGEDAGEQALLPGVGIGRYPVDALRQPMQQA